MGLLDLFRKKKPFNMEKVLFEELNSWIELESQAITKEKKSFTNEMKSRINQLDDELEHGIKDLNDIDWEKIKTEERIKNIVIDNLDNYIVHLKQLKLDLSNLGEVERTKINSIFIDFEKRAGKNYQKVSFLIGKNLEVINGNMKNLFRDLDKIQKENKILIERAEVIPSVSKKLEELKNTQNSISEIYIGIKKIHNEVEKLELKIKDSEEQIKKVKENKDFQIWQANQDNYSNSKHKRNSMIVSLREIIDLKSLAKVWHENKNEMKIIKKYRENFEKSFNEDKEEILKGLINSLENHDLINKKIEEISNLDKEIKGITLEKSLTSDLEEDIKIAQKEIESLKAEEIREEKKTRKMVTDKDNIKEVIINSLKEIGTEVI